MVNISLLILRLCIGIVFLAHGLQVAAGLFGGPGISGFSGMLGNMGFKPSLFWAYLAGYTELLGGLCLILGILPRLAAFSILIFMLVAVYAVHLTKGFFIQNGGFEYNFVLICICLVIMILGAGRFSILNRF